MGSISGTVWSSTHLPRFQLLLGDPGPQALVNDLVLSSLQPWCVRDLQLLLTLGYLAVTCWLLIHFIDCQLSTDSSQIGTVRERNLTTTTKETLGSSTALLLLKTRTNSSDVKQESYYELAEYPVQELRLRDHHWNWKRTPLKQEKSSKTYKKTKHTHTKKPETLTMNCLSPHRLLMLIYHVGSLLLFISWFLNMMTDGSICIWLDRGHEDRCRRSKYTNGVKMKASTQEGLLCSVVCTITEQTVLICASSLIARFLCSAHKFPFCSLSSTSAMLVAKNSCIIQALWTTK